MRNHNRADFAEYTTPDLAAYDYAAAANYDAYRALQRSRPRKLVNTMCEDVTEIIYKIMAARDLDEMIALELRLQNDDLEKYANSPNDRKNVEQGLADLESGMHSYNTLKNNPKQYRENAKGYTDSNRDKRLNVPKDGMRYTLASQATRLQNRQSLQLSEEEKEILTARRGLVNAIREEYSALQTQVMRDDD